MINQETKLPLYCPSLQGLSHDEINNLNIYRVHNQNKKYRYSNGHDLISKIPELQENESWLILLFIGDHVSVRYSQLLYFMKNRIKRQTMSKILQTLDYFQLIQKWKIELVNKDAPEKSYEESAFTLTEYGYQMLKYWCGKQYFYHPKYFDKHGKYVHMRYWQDIDMLCHLRYKSAFIDHKMHAKLSGGLLPASFCFRVSQQENKQINFLVYSVIESEDLRKIKSIMSAWDEFVEKGKNLIINDYPLQPTVLVIYVSSVKKAKYINHELMIDLKKANIRICVAEVLHKDGLVHAFFNPLPEGDLQQIQISLFN